MKSEFPEAHSASVLLVASAERLQVFTDLLANVCGCSFESHGDVHSASVAIGLRLPAIVILDLEEKTKERQAFLRSLMANPELAPIKVIVIGGRTASIGQQLVPARLTHVATPGSTPEAVRAILRDASKSTPRFDKGSTFPFAANENQRLLALDRSGLVDTVPEEAFDRLTWLAGRSLGMPVALFTVLTSTRQWFKSRQGLDIQETPRDWAFCNRTILQRDVFTVENLSTNLEFRGNPAVVGSPHFRFYAGAPVIDSDGYALGSLCVMDYKPRTLDPDQVRTLLSRSSLRTRYS